MVEEGALMWRLDALLGIPLTGGGRSTMGDPHNPACFLARHGVMENGDPMTPCEGRLVKAHIFPRSLLKRRFPHGAMCHGARGAWSKWESAPTPKRRPVGKGHRFVSLAALIEDSRTWVWACGGLMGNAGHHGELDFSRRLRVPFDALPEGTLEFAREFELLAWLEGVYL